jgi:hypothetical protein
MSARSSRARTRARSGGCQCGRIRFTSDGEPRDVHFCHCSTCRRATGNAIVTLVWFADERIAWAGEPPAIYRSSAIASRGSRRECGTPLFLKYVDSGQIAFMAGCFDEPGGFHPSHHYGAESRLGRADIGSQLPGYPTDVDPRP